MLAFTCKWGHFPLETSSWCLFDSLQTCYKARLPLNGNGFERILKSMVHAILGISQVQLLSTKSSQPFLWVKALTWSMFGAWGYQSWHEMILIPISSRVSERRFSTSNASRVSMCWVLQLSCASGPPKYWLLLLLKSLNAPSTNGALWSSYSLCSAIS